MCLAVWVNDSNPSLVRIENRQSFYRVQLDHLERLISSRGDTIAVHLQSTRAVSTCKCMNMYLSPGCR